MTDLGGNRFFAQRQNIIVLTVVKVDLLHRTGLMHYEHGMHVYWNHTIRDAILTCARKPT